MNECKKLYRIEKGAKVAGVCGGIGEYFNLDANLFRLIMAMAILFSCGSLLILYLVAACILPKKSDVYPDF